MSTIPKVRWLARYHASHTSASHTPKWQRLMQDALGVDDAQLLKILTALVERNRSIWGTYCQATISQWYGDIMVTGVKH